MPLDDTHGLVKRCTDAMARPRPEPISEPIDPSAVVVEVGRRSRAPKPTPPTDLVDALALAHEVAEAFGAERMQVRVEATPGDPQVPSNAPDLRRVLRWMIDQASLIEGGAPWLTLRVIVSEDSVGYELPWFGTARAAVGSDHFEGAVAELGASFHVLGLRARLELPRVRDGAAPLVSGMRPRALDDEDTDPPPTS
jgi:hypothetical protein